MADKVRAISEMRSSPEYSPGDFVISNKSVFLEFEPKVLDQRMYDSKIQVTDYMNLHPYIFEQKYGFPKPDDQTIDWGNQVYLLIDYNARSKKWKVFECPEFMMGEIHSGVGINSWTHLPEEHILTQVEPMVVNHPVHRWWLIEDLEEEGSSVNEYLIKLKSTESWDTREGLWKIPSQIDPFRSKVYPGFLFKNSMVVGDPEVDLIPLGTVFCVNAEKVLKQHAPGFLIKVKSDDYKYDEGGNKAFNNEKYRGAETYQKDGFEYYYTDIRNFNLKFKLVDNTDPYCIFLHDLEFQ